MRCLPVPQTLELKLQSQSIQLTLGEPKATTLERLARFDCATERDAEMRRGYLTITGQGVLISFPDGILSTIFLCISGGLENVGAFQGTTNLLPRRLFDDPDESAFTMALDQQGFGSAARDYPFAVDRVSDGLRVRLERRPEKTMIMIDDGAIVR